MANTIHAKAGDQIQIINDNEADWITVGCIYKVIEVLHGQESDGSKCFRLFDSGSTEVGETWWGLPRHYEIVYPDFSKEQILLMEAARRYPKGTHYLEVGSGWFGSKHHSTHTEPFVYDFVGGGPRIAVQSAKGIVYNKGVWSPIVHETYQPFHTDDTVVRWRDIEDWEWNDIGMIDCRAIGVEGKVTNVSPSDGLEKVPSIELDNNGWYPATAFIFSQYYSQSQTNRGTAERLNDLDYGKESRTIEVQRPFATIISGERTSGSGVQGRGNAAIIRGRHLSYKKILGK